MIDHALEQRFRQFLSTRGLRLTPQRRRLFERVFSTEEHFTAETLVEWMREEEGHRVSRATVYRTLRVLEEGGFLRSFATGTGELVYEHVRGHEHHDHIVCLGCGRIAEFHDERIEALQEEIARALGFELSDHEHKLLGYCASCVRRREESAASDAGPAAHRSGAGD